jgi:hypothetical protein
MPAWMRWCFSACDERPVRRLEPDWPDHLRYDMNIVIAAALVWRRLVVLPTGPKTDAKKELMKPFDIQGTYATEADCKADVASNLASYVARHGLPAGTTANFVCTTN